MFSWSTDVTPSPKFEIAISIRWFGMKNNLEIGDDAHSSEESVGVRMIGLHWGEYRSGNGWIFVKKMEDDSGNEGEKEIYVALIWQWEQDRSLTLWNGYIYVIHEYLA